MNNAPEDISSSVHRLNEALQVDALPEKTVSSIARSADVNMTFEDLSEHPVDEFPRDKERRYAMFVRHANALWNALKDVPCDVLSEDGTITVRSGSHEQTLPDSCDATNFSAVERIHAVLGQGTIEAVNAAFEVCKDQSLDLPDAFAYSMERVASGSQEGAQIVYNIARSIAETHRKTAGALITPEQFDSELDNQLSQVKKIMKLNIVADEWLDALMYGDTRLFDRNEREEHSDVKVVFRSEVVNLLEEVANRFCRGSEISEFSDLQGMFDEMHAVIVTHVPEHDLGEQGNARTRAVFDHVLSLCIDHLSSTEGAVYTHRVIQELELTLFRTASRRPMYEWSPEERSFAMTALLIKSAYSWHTERNIRSVSGCPMLYSRVLPQWYAKVCQPVKQWYAAAYERESL